MSEIQTRRLLVADDEEAILAAYRRIFQASQSGTTADSAASLEAELFGKAPAKAEASIELVTCRQGDEAIEAVRRGLAEGRPIPVAYLDVRMPPGPNGIETARAIRALDPNIHIAIITGYSDMAPERIAELVQPADRLFYFEKPFRGIELRQLARALIAKWHAERALEAARDDLENQVEERTAALAKAKEAAERANDSKSVFLTNMSHELRTPLNAVIGFSDLMLTEALGPIGHPKYREYVGDISASGKHLLNLINSILDLAQADRGTLSLIERPLDLGETISAALRIVHPQAIQAQVTLRKGAMTDGEIYADRTKVCQILINVLANAVKFTPEGGEVSIETERAEDGELVIRITDSGVGIRAEDIPRALQPFVQVGIDSSGYYSGTGLGLPLSLALAQLHGGSLELQSTVGVGTTVTIRFPRERVLEPGSRLDVEPRRRLSAG
ncbi:MAG: ATP-binding protein [Alphaproteobacteria bacterium]